MMYLTTTRTVVLCLLLALLVFAAVAAVAAAQQLAMLIEVSRHGVRAPLDFKGNAAADEAHWFPMGEGKLTQVGATQHYMLGQKLRQRYLKATPSLLSDIDFNSVNRKVHVQAADSQRCILSAQYQVSGLLSPATATPNQLLAVPIDVVSKKHDNVLNPKIRSATFCPKLNQLAQSVWSSDAWRQLQQQYAPMMQYFANVTGNSIELEDSLEGIHDILQCYNAAAFPLPFDNLSDDMVNQVEPAIVAAHKLEYASKQVLSLTAGPMLETIIGAINKYAAGATERKVIVMVGHDSVLVPLLVAFNNFNQVPGFAASLVIEVYNTSISAASGADASSAWILNFFYNDEQFTPAGCSSVNCSFSEFSSYYSQYVAESWSDSCVVDDDNNKGTNWNNIAIIVVSAASLGILCLVVFLFCFPSAKSMCRAAIEARKRLGSREQQLRYSLLTEDNAATNNSSRNNNNNNNTGSSNNRDDDSNLMNNGAIDNDML